MKRIMSEHELDQKLKDYMAGGGEAAFALDESRVFGGTADRKPRFSRRMQMVAASLVILLIAAFAIPPVRAAIGKLFTFIPGIGIVEKNDESVYTFNPIVEKVQSYGNGDVVELDNAVYRNGYLMVTLSGRSREKTYFDTTVYRNDKPMIRGSASSSWAGNDGYISISYKTEKPLPEDIFTIGVDGFPDELNFTMTECGDFQTLADIGPTDTQNGISITALAGRNDEGILEVWCYPFGLQEDRLVGIGEMNRYSGGSRQTCIETESGRIGLYNYSGSNILERLMFDLPDEDTSATLHITSLSFLRDEKITFSIPVPENYSTVPCDIVVRCSLGTLNITGITRKPNEHSAEEPDTMGIHLSFTSKESGKALYGFSTILTKGRSSSRYMRQTDEETGALKYIETDVIDGAKKMTFEVSGLLYYQTGEYVIPLEIR